MRYDSAGNLEGNFDGVFLHQGIYAFRLSKEGKAAVAYVGKTEGNGRLRNHLTAKNKDGSDIATSLRHKHKYIRQAIQDGYTVHVCMYSNPDFGKPSLSCVELATSQAAKVHLKKIFPEVETWNKRDG